MVENGLLESSQILRELEHRLAPDFPSGGSARARVTEFNEPDFPTISTADTQSRERSSTKTDTSQDLRRIKEQPAQEPLDDIASLLLGLSFGQMIELCDAMWNGHPENAPLTREQLPPLLHRWAVSRASATHYASEERRPK
jgi:hypothetical protein